MDKIVEHLNEMGIKAIRIVENFTKIPPDKIQQYKEGKIMVLSEDKEEHSLEELQKRLVALVEKHEGKQKILYIGSRLDTVNYDFPLPM